MHTIDVFVQTYFLNVRTQGVTEFMFIIGRIFDVTIYSVSITIFMAVLIYLLRGKIYSLLFIGSMFSGAFLTFIFKLLFNVARPTGAVYVAFGQSFPSYHSVISTIFFAMMIYVFDDYLKGIWRKVFNIFCLVSVSVIAFSRIYLGVHWLSDVLGGIILGLTISYVSIKIHQKIVKYRRF